MTSVSRTFQAPGSDGNSPEGNGVKRTPPRGSAAEVEALGPRFGKARGRRGASDLHNRLGLERLGAPTPESRRHLLRP